MCLGVGITIADFEILTLGMIMDILITKINQNSEEKEATQADMDKFAKGL